jgi:transcriptional regulator with XRE-family HTH domain
MVKGITVKETEVRQILSFNIKLFRQRKGLSQAKLAEKMKISTNYLSDIETCRGWVSPLSLAKLAYALDIEVFELFKPPKNKNLNVSAIMNRCLDDLSVSLKQAFDKSLGDTIKKLRQTY